MANYKRAELEAFRRRCVELKEQGWAQTHIAEAFGLSQAWVSRTLNAHRHGGTNALAARKAAGKTPALTSEQLQGLVEALNQGSQAHGFALWTRRNVGAVAEKLYGVRHDPSHIGRLLKKVGWSRQRPQRKARQQSAQQVAAWHKERLPTLKKSR